jgi:signal transduction histidine kinase/AraC-like DNA-binding protein/DNA-binding response OmpR family regulator/ABC-type sugar transport system substrate-binding protein
MSNVLRIGAAIDPNDPYWAQVREATHARAKELALDLVSINLIPEPLSQEEQMALLEELLALELDALIAWALPNDLALQISQYSIPLVLLSETDIRHPLLVSPSGLDNVVQVGSHYLAEETAGQGNILIVGDLAQANLQESDVFHDYPDISFTHIACPTFYEREQAHQHIHKALQETTDSVDAILGLTDDLALAGRDACRTLGLTDHHTLTVGIGGTPSSLAAIAEGDMTATVEIRTDELGKRAVDLAYQASQGQQLPPHFGYQTRLTTHQNVAEVAAQKLAATANLYKRVMSTRRQQQQQRLTQLETSLEISRRVGSILDHRQLSHEIANLIRANYGYDRVQIFRWLEQEQRLALEQPGQTQTDQDSIPLTGSGVLGQALMRNEPIFIPDTHQSPRFPPDPNWPDTRARVVLPIRMGGQVIGLLDLHSQRSALRTSHELVGLQSLADQLGIAMSNASLYGEALQARATAEKADRLKTRLLANVSHELRTPLNTILGFVRPTIESPATYDNALPADLLNDLRHVYRSAEHLLWVINDLLDLSRAEIDELDLHREIIEPRSFLEQIFQSMAAGTPKKGDIEWRLQLPERLPAIQADPVRLRQILLNLLSNAAKFTDAGQVVLGAETTPPLLHIWVQDTGAGIPIDMQERIFEPFVTAERSARPKEGIGLGLSITRQLVTLHGGSMTLESQPGQGSTFHVYLPLPSLGEQTTSLFPTPARPVLLLISNQDQPASEIVSFCQRQGLETCRLQTSDDIDKVVAEVQPVALAWDQANADSTAWVLIEQLRNHPQLCQVPFILYGQRPGEEAALSTGMTDFVVKPVSGKTLMETINALCPPASAGPVLIVDDDPQACELYQGLVAKGFPGYAIRTANDGAAALGVMAEETPCLVILDLMMPKMNGFEVLDWMRADEQTRQVPVLVLTGQMLTLEDIKQLEQHAKITFQGKGILSEEETTASLHRLLLGEDALPPHTSSLVKRAVAYLHQNYHRSLSRLEIANAIGVSENYLTHIFGRELGLSPWQYLNRYRIKQARDLLRRTSDSITAVALQVGFNDPAYFSRVFRKQVGVSPSAYREQAE